MERIDKVEKIQDYTFRFQAMADDLALFTSPDDAIRVLRRTLELMEERKQEPASDEFQIAVRIGGTLVATCEGCQRTYFATGEPQCYEEGRLEKLRDLARLQPQSYIEVSAYDNIEFGDLCGKNVVVDCDCGYVRNFERIFWNHRLIIEQFFKLRTERIRGEAKRATALSNSVTDSVGILNNQP